MTQTFTAFAGTQRIASGPVESMIRRTKAVLDRGESRTLLIFDDRTGREIDFDLSGTEEEVVAKLDGHPGLDRPETPPKRGPGRPKLGVVSREVSLLPRHWDWLSNQPGGMSGALRRLVDEARKKDAAPERQRKARDAASRFMWTMAGNLENFEEASRLLYRDDLEGLRALIAGWPEDIRAHVEALITRGEA
ncbi:MAG: DUF2239 family protein [Deltaproteobacteria bacterium]|jgi:hypothetical protein